MYFLSMIVLVFTAVTSGSAALIQKVEDDFYKELGMTAEYPAESCREIYNKNPVGRTQSGYYWVRSCEKTMKVIYIYIITYYSKKYIIYIYIL